MKYRPFGKTELRVSEVGFGAWGIGGGVMAGNLPIGWGQTDDRTSIDAIQAALERGVNFFDTADFYGLGRSETLLGEVIGNRPGVLIATKVGHRLDRNGQIYTDYSKAYIREACEKSLFRLRREAIDYYQLHTAKTDDLEKGECIEAMQELQSAGKIRYWGVSLNTFQPEPEAQWLLEHGAGQGIQLVLNLLNQQSCSLLPALAEAGFGLIARMPLQFGLLTGKFDADSTFPPNDHRSFRLPKGLLAQVLVEIEPLRHLAIRHGTDLAGLAMSFVLAFPEISTVIPGMKTRQQVQSNCGGLIELPAEARSAIQALYTEKWANTLMPLLREAG